MRDCLNEEITQALGPANDLYRLPDSIWNDDNFHGMATPFDMLILRALYQPELQSGMSRAEVAAALPARARPGEPARAAACRAQPRHPESKAWASAIEAALSRDAPRAKRHRGGDASPTQIAAEMRPVDHRLGVSLLTLGRLSLRRDPAAAAQDFTQAYELFRREFGPDDVRTAQAGVHLAALALGTGQYQTRDHAGRPARPGGARRAERHPPRRPPVDQGRGAGRARRDRGGAGQRASTACAGRAMASATPTGRSPASRRSSPRSSASRTQ